MDTSLVIMKYALASLFLCAGILLPVLDMRADTTQRLIHHDIEARIDPAQHMITVRDRITVPFGREFRFVLHRGLNPSVETKGVSLAKERGHADSDAESYRVTLPRGQTAFSITYEGTILHPIEPLGKEQARGFSDTPGVISGEGVYLSPNSLWYPVSDDALISFSLRATLPAGWGLMSQGKRTLHDRKKNLTEVRWESPEPQEGIFAVAAKFTEYERSSGHITAMVFLREPDKTLADKYIEATIRYISMYEKLIGPYPYSKFALVENFWETGFGMPSFTLLGPKIIRFPFIITSSYPHEILHNWWGNSVFPDFDSGNWSEGITAYLSDYLLKEQEGSGTEYRQTTLQKYADYVSGAKDFPLTEFHSRHGSSSEAVGYGKALMFFHMLRRELGDEVFVRGLKDFYTKNRFRIASFKDIRISFESVSGRDLGSQFRQWVENTGAPQIRLSNTRATKDSAGFSLTADLIQVQSGDAYTLRIPVAVTMKDRGEAYQTDVAMDTKHVKLSLRLPAQPLRIDVDPEFDLFRRLDREEIPPAISQALGAKKMLILLPSSAPGKLLREYRVFAKMLGDSGPDETEIRMDSEVKALPPNRAVAVLGWENRFLSEVASALSGYEVSLNGKNVLIGNTSIPKEDHSLVVAARNHRNSDMAILFVAGPGKALASLGRKLPHYHKYSYLGFEGSESDNIAKGRWPVTNSPLTASISYGKESSRVEVAALAPRKPLISPPPMLKPGYHGTP